MKVCPRCEQAFNDDTLQFCLIDGTALVPAEGQATVVMSSPAVTVSEPTVVTTQPMYPAEPPKKKNTVVIVLLTVVIMLFGVVIVAGVLYYFLGGPREGANANQKNGVNAANPKPSATPKPSLTPTPIASPSPANAVKPTPGNESDDVTPIMWTTSAATFKSDPGLTYKFQCPADGVPEMIWGSDVYTADSSICTAAVHAGIITLEKGGVVAIEFKPGRAAYGSTVRNGITSNTYGEFDHSFVVR
jgi:LCCL domain